MNQSKRSSEIVTLKKEGDRQKKEIVMGKVVRWDLLSKDGGETVGIYERSSTERFSPFPNELPAVETDGSGSINGE